MLKLENTVRAYSGKPGCMCGCNGVYNEGDRARKMAATALLKHPAVKLHTWTEAGADVGCMYVETATRTRALYLTAEGVAAVRAMGVK